TVTCSLPLDPRAIADGAGLGFSGIHGSPPSETGEGVVERWPWPAPGLPAGAVVPSACARADSEESASTSLRAGGRRIAAVGHSSPHCRSQRRARHQLARLRNADTLILGSPTLAGKDVA